MQTITTETELDRAIKYYFPNFKEWHNTSIKTELMKDILNIKLPREVIQAYIKYSVIKDDEEYNEAQGNKTSPDWLYEYSGGKSRKRRMSRRKSRNNKKKTIRRKRR